MIPSASDGRKENKNREKQAYGDRSQINRAEGTSTGEIVSNSHPESAKDTVATLPTRSRTPSASKENQYLWPEPSSANSTFQQHTHDIAMQIPPAATLLQESMLTPLFQDYPEKQQIIRREKEEEKHIDFFSPGTSTRPSHEIQQLPRKKSKHEQGPAEVAKDKSPGSDRFTRLSSNESQNNKRNECFLPAAPALTKVTESLFDETLEGSGPTKAAGAASQHSASESSEELSSLNLSFDEDDEDKKSRASSSSLVRSRKSSSRTPDATKGKSQPSEQKIDKASWSWLVPSRKSSSPSPDASKEKSQPSEQKIDQEIKWNQHFQELCQYKNTYGHVNVPYTYEENPSLARWVKRQRHQYRLQKQGQLETLPLSLDRVQALEQLGFKWDTYADVWNQRLAELKLYKAKYNSCDVPCRFAENPQLAIWVKSQRRQFRLYTEGRPTSITGERIRELEALGFNWVLRKYKNRGRNKNT